MKKLLIFKISLLLCFTSCRKEDAYKETIINREPAILETRVKVAIIDTGITLNDTTTKFLCKTGHKDFVGGGIEDKHGHGTNIAGIVSRNLDTTKFCLVIYRYYSNGSQAFSNLNNEIASFEEAVKQDVKFINFSGGGLDPSKKETEIVTVALKKGIKIAVAAGNDGNNLTAKCQYYPACVPDTTGNLYAVGNCKDGKYVASSNYGGPVRQCENGLNVEGFGIKMSGTSQSTAIFTNRLIKQYEQESKDR